MLLELGEPKADPTCLYAFPDHVWRIFWTYSKRHFETFRRAFEADPASALTDWDVPEYTIRPSRAPSGLKALDLLTEEQAHTVELLFLRNGERACLGGFKPPQGKKTAAILDATPATFRAVYFAEWLQWYMECLADDNNWRLIHRLRSIISATERGAPIPEFEKALRTKQRSPRATQALTELRAYARDCAMAGLEERAPFEKAVRVQVSDNAWRVAADDIRQRSGVVHPALNQRSHLEHYTLDAHEREALIAYFDVYVLGAQRRSDAKTIDTYWRSVEEALGWVRQHHRALLQRVSHAALMREIDVHLPEKEEGRRVDLLKRYCEQCASAGYAWWTEADIALREQNAWDKLPPFSGGSRSSTKWWQVHSSSSSITVSSSTITPRRASRALCVSSTVIT